MAMTTTKLSKELKNKINRTLKALNLGDDISPKDLKKSFWKKFNKNTSKSKRFPSGYNLFCKDKRAEFTKDGKSPQDVMRDLGAAWKKSSEEEKNKYNGTAKTAKLEFLESSPPKPKKSKRFPSGYNLFCKDNRSELSSDGKSPQDVMRSLGAAWKSASDEIKDKYNDKAKSLKPDGQSVASMTLKELKSMCKEKNLKVSGKKSDLIKRLENPSQHVKKQVIPEELDSDTD